MKIGLFLSRDDGKISKTVDVDMLASRYSYLPVSRVYDNFFRYADQEDMLRTVSDYKLEGVVLAGNSPQYFEKMPGGTLILEAIRDRGVNPNKIAFANIKEQVALPHRNENAQANEKAKLLIDCALAKVEMCHKLRTITVSPRRSVMVVGTTIGGLTATQELLAKGYRVYLIEKEPGIRQLAHVEETILPILTAVQSDPKTRLLLNTRVVDVSGWCGDYRVILMTPGGKEQITVGGIILSLGDDTEWIQELRPKMQLDVDHKGLLKGRRKVSLMGRTRDPGIRFVPFSPDDRLASEMKGGSTAVLSLTTILDKNEIEHPVLVSEVDENVCGGCGTCVKTCAFSASSIDPIRKVSVIDATRCKGCGNCVVACPTGARDLVSFPEKYVIKAIDILSSGTADISDPKILVLLCNGSGSPAVDTAGELADQDAGLRYSPNVLPLQVECGGNVDTQYILSAFAKGFDGVVMAVCRDGHCHNIVGNTDMERRLGLFREVLRSREINDDRLRVMHVSPHEGKQFSEDINAFSEDLKSMNIAEGR